MIHLRRGGSGGGGVALAGEIEGHAGKADQRDEARFHCAFSCEGLMKICSIERAKTSAILKASGSEGS